MINDVLDYPEIDTDALKLYRNGDVIIFEEVLNTSSAIQRSHFPDHNYYSLTGLVVNYFQHIRT